MTTASNSVTLEDISLPAAGLDARKASDIYREHGCLVVRGLMSQYVPAINRDIERAFATALSLLPQARQAPEGWYTPDGSLWLPAPRGYARDKQIMVLNVGYRTSAAFFTSGVHPPLLEVVSAIIGPDVEMFLDGQCLYKEPVGGHPKHLHQDAAYFEHRFEGPVAILTYCVPTDLRNGALHVVPGSHKLGLLKHVDTFSHLGLEEKEWPWERALPVIGGPGDAIFFHVKTIHGSKENHSDKPRPVFIHRYRRADDYVTIGASSAANRAVAEKHADQARKENQLGLMVRGSRGYDPKRDA